MKRICKICERTFEWHRPSGYNGKSPTICGKIGKDGRWKSNSECEKERNHRAYLKWKAKQPYLTWKRNLEDKPKLRREKNITRDVPKTERQYPCKRCGELSVNRFYCPTCLTILSDRIAGDEYISTGCGATLDLEVIK